MDQCNICRNIQEIEQLVRKCLSISQKTYGLTKRLKTSEEIGKYFPGFLAFVDCTEHQIPRPIDIIKRKIFYSGKKKIHIIKIQLMVDNRGFILH
ncbi:MAG TPA: transposase family protein [Candidatus Nitrosocosmicus sp.]